MNVLHPILTTSTGRHRQISCRSGRQPTAPAVDNLPVQNAQTTSATDSTTKPKPEELDQAAVKGCRTSLSSRSITH